jgi:Mrp family chromosome partitioning ATPase
MSRKMRGIRKILVNLLGVNKNLSIFICASKGESTKTINKGIKN